jgi:hypothetical protein
MPLYSPDRNEEIHEEAQQVFGFEHEKFQGRRMNVNQSTELLVRFIETGSCYTRYARTRIIAVLQLTV